MKQKPKCKLKNTFGWQLVVGVALVIFIFALSYPIHKTPEPLGDDVLLQSLAAGIIPDEYQAGSGNAQYMGSTFPAPPVAAMTVPPKVLGDNTPSDKHIEVDLTNQKVYAVENGRPVMEFTVSTGKWGRTPTGEFTIWAKVKAQKMSGGSKELHTYYYLPNVPWVMFFYNDEVTKIRGFSFHGTYWHENFGHPMSHGCINMKTPEAKILYDWANPPVTNSKAWATLANADNPGTKVVIYGETPAN